MTNRRRGISAVLAVILVLAVALAVISGIFYATYTSKLPSSSSQSSSAQTIVGTGVASADFTPDQSVISINFGTSNCSAVQAVNTIQKIETRVASSLASLGITSSQINVTSYSLSTNGGVPNQSSTCISPNFQASESETITITNANFSFLKNDSAYAIDSVSETGASVQNVNFIASPALQSSLSTELNQQALNQAELNAKSVASASGLSLGSIVSIDTNTLNFPCGYYYSGCSIYNPQFNGLTVNLMVQVTYQVS